VRKKGEGRGVRFTLQPVEQPHLLGDPSGHGPEIGARPPDGCATMRQSGHTDRASRAQFLLRSCPPLGTTRAAKCSHARERDAVRRTISSLGTDKRSRAPATRPLGTNTLAFCTYKETRAPITSSLGVYRRPFVPNNDAVRLATPAHTPVTHPVAPETSSHRPETVSNSS